MKNFKSLTLIFLIVLTFSCKDKNDEIDPGDSTEVACLKKSSERYSDGKLAYRSFIEYDKFFNVSYVKDEYYGNSSNPSIQERVFENIYDSKNLLVKSISRVGYEIYMETSYEYHANLKLKSRTMTAPGNSYLKIQEFDDKGRMTRFYDGDAGWEFLTSYDERGNVITRRTMLKNEFRGGEKNVYNKDFQIISSTYTYSDNSTRVTKYYYDADKRLVQRVDEQVTKYYYNMKGLLVNEKVYQGTKLVDEVRSEYDESGKLIKKISLGNLNVFYISAEYEYYSNGKLRRESNYTIKSGSESQRYKYYEYSLDESGNELESTSYRENGTREQGYTYTYQCK